MSQAAWLRVNRADEALRQEDRYNEMDAIANKINKLVKKGSKGKPQAESDRLFKIVIWAIFEDGLDAAIHEMSNKIREIEKEKKKMRHDELCKKLFERETEAEER